MKRGFDEPIDKRRLSVVSLPVWLAYVTSFSIPIRIQVHTSVAVVPTHASLRICFFQVLNGLLQLDYLLQSISSVKYYISKGLFT